MFFFSRNQGHSYFAGRVFEGGGRKGKEERGERELPTRFF
jgi:hypothetical protein